MNLECPFLSFKGATQEWIRRRVWATPLATGEIRKLEDGTVLDLLPDDRWKQPTNPSRLVFQSYCKWLSPHPLSRLIFPGISCGSPISVG